jgi:hypothetical protein
MNNLLGASKMHRSLNGLTVIPVLVGLLAWGCGGREYPTAPSSEGELLLTPANPIPGSRIDVEYRQSGFFGRADSLVLRARFRRADDIWYNHATRQVSVGYLVKESDGLFRSRFQQPADVVFGVFAVEDAAGERIDHNAGSLWELLVYDGERPSYDALLQRQYDLMDRDWEAAAQSAERRAELYPEDPAAWRSVYTFNRQVFGESYSDTAISTFRTIFRSESPTACTAWL